MRANHGKAHSHSFCIFLLSIKSLHKNFFMPKNEHITYIAAEAYMLI